MNVKFNFLNIGMIFFIILFKYFIIHSVEQKMLYLFLGIICLIFLLNIYYRKFKKKQLLTILILFIFSLYLVIVQKDVNLLISCMLGIIINGKDEKSFVKIFFFSSLILYVSTIFLNIIGVVESKNMIRIVNNEILTRYSIGFNHPNEVFLFFIPIAFSGYYLYGNKKLFYIILFIVTIILYKLSYSRTGLITILLMVILHFTRKIWLNKKITKIIPYLFFIFTILSIVIAVLYGNSTNNIVSEILSDRPYYWNYYIKHGKFISLIGLNKIEGIYLDNMYIYLLVQLGLIGYSIYSYIYIKSLKNIKLNDKMYVLIISFFIYGLTETNVIIGSINFILAIQISNLLIESWKEKNENKCNNTSV